jgi:hypothetical protein
MPSPSTPDRGIDSGHSPRHAVQVIRHLAAAALLLSLAACATADPAAAPQTPSAWEREQAAGQAAAQAAPTSSADSYQCIGIRRAYEAWLNALSSNLDFNEVGYSRVSDAGKRLLEDVSGWDDQPSKDLAVAVSQYNYELALANAQYVIGGKLEPGQADKMTEAMSATGDAYSQLLAATCA